MAMVDVDVDGSSHLYWQTHSPSRLAWFEGWQPPQSSVCIHQVNQVNSCNGFGDDDSNIGTCIIIITIKE